MKKRFLVLAIAIMFMLCPLLTACGDSVIGEWKISGYSYEFYGEEKFVTLEEADALVYDEEVTDMDSEQFDLNMVWYMNASREDANIEFRNDGKVVLASNEYDWSYVGETIVMVIDEETQVTFIKLEDGQLKMIYPIPDFEVQLNVFLSK